MTRSLHSRGMQTLEITQRDPEQIQPWHDVRDDDKVAQLAASMREHGWQGAPVVVIPGTDYGWGEGDPIAITGSHRIAAAIEAEIDVPAIDLNDLLAAHDLTLAELDDEHGTQPDDELHQEAVERLDYHLPRDVVEYYGLDAH